LQGVNKELFVGQTMLSELYDEMPSAAVTHRAAVLNAAADLLADDDAASLSVKRIADRAGASTQLIYTAFSGKLGVIDALYRQGFQMLRRKLEAVPVNPGLGYVGDLGRAYRESALERPTYFDVMFSRVVPEFRPSNSTVAFALSAFAVLEQGVRLSVTAGELVTNDPAAFARMFWGATHGLVALELAGYLVGDDPSERYDTLIDQLLTGGKRP
jgi:AcrR family transcriptional regulator